MEGGRDAEEAKEENGEGHRKVMVGWDPGAARVQPLKRSLAKERRI